MGQSIYEFAHPCDHEEIQDVLAPHGKGDERTAARTIFIRLKCTLTSKGRSVNLKSAVYKVSIFIAIFEVIENQFYKCKVKPVFKDHLPIENIL